MAQFKFADSAFMAVTKKVMEEYFGDRLLMLKRRDDMPADIKDVPKEMICMIPQDDPLWLQARAVPNLITASTLGEMLGMHDADVAKEFDISKTMIKPNGTTNVVWDGHIERLSNPSLPKPQFSLMGSTFAEWGKQHENNCNSMFLERNPQFTYEERGLTFVLPATIREWGLKNVITGERFESLPFELAASPDGLLHRINELTGQRETFNCEWKCAAAYKPLGKTEFPGISFFYDKRTKPYDKIKSYYIPQVQLQMLACGNKRAYWGCWSLLNGMRVWLVDANIEYLSIMLSLLVHLHENFAIANHCVPTGYFTNPALCNSDRARAVYARFIKLTVDMMYAKEHAFYPDTLPVTEKIIAHEGQAPSNTTEGTRARDDTVSTAKTGSDMVVGEPSRWRNERVFPEFPSEVPDFAILGIYTRIFFEDSLDKPRWAEDPEDVDARLANIRAIMKLPYMLPLTAMVKTLLAVQPQHQRHEKHRNVTMWRYSNAEKYLVAAIKPLYLLRVSLKLRMANMTQFEDADDAEDIESYTQNYIRNELDNSMACLFKLNTDGPQRCSPDVMEECERIITLSLNMFLLKARSLPNYERLRKDDLLRIPSVTSHIQCMVDTLKSNQYDNHQKMFMMSVTAKNIHRITTQ